MISVIIPTYNRHVWLGRALGSLWRQTYTDWECIVVKNGLPERSAYLEALAPYWDDQRLVLVLDPVASLPRALNRGTGLARGDALAFLEDDDEWRPTFLAEMYRELQSHHDVDFVYCDQVEMYKGEIVNWVSPPDPKRQDRQMLLGGNWISFPMVMLRSVCLRTLDGFDEEAGPATDWDTWLRLSLQHRLHHLQRTLVTHHWLSDKGNYCLNPEASRQARSYIQRKRARGAYN